MADDIETHGKTINITQPMKLSDFIDMIIKLRYLPYISGGKATWVIRYQNKPLAVIGIKKYEPDMSEYKIKLLLDDRKFPKLLSADSEKKFGFGYYAQEDYSSIYKKMKVECRGGYNV